MGELMKKELGTIEKLKQMRAKLEHDLGCINLALEYAEKDDDTAAAVEAIMRAFRL